MPLVRISLVQGKSARYGRQVGAVVYRTKVDTLKVPLKDNFQIITEHETDGLVYDQGYLGIACTGGVILIQITLNEGRAIELKKACDQVLADRLHRKCPVPGCRSRHLQLSWSLRGNGGVSPCIPL